MYEMIKNNRLTIAQVQRLLRTKKGTVYKHIERHLYKKDDKSATVDAESFKQYVLNRAYEHKAKAEYYASIYNRLVERRG